MGGPFSSYVDATHPSTPALLGHAIADQIQAAHAKGLAEELIDRQKLVDQFQAIESDQSYDAQAREAARNYAFQLKFLRPTDKRPKQFEHDKDGRVPALVDVTYRKVMRDGPADPGQPAEPQEPGAPSAAGGGPPASISPMPDIGFDHSDVGFDHPSNDSFASSLGPARPSSAVPLGGARMPGGISPSPVIPGVAANALPPPPQIDMGEMGGMQQPTQQASSPAIPPPPSMPQGIPAAAIAPPSSPLDSSLAPGQPPGTVSTRMSPIDSARQQANIKAIESMVPISREQAAEMGIHGAPDWPGMPGMVAVHPKALEGTRYSLDRQARLVAQGIDPTTMERLPWKSQLDEAMLQVRQAQAEGQRLINENKPQEAAALMMRANAAVLTAEAAMRHATNPSAGGVTVIPIVDSAGNMLGTYGAPKAPGFTPSDGVPEGGRKTPEPPTAIDRRTALQATLDNLDRLDVLGTKHQDVIGFLSGPLTDMARRTIGIPGDVNELFRLSDDIADMLLRARSGAQINEQEYVRLRALVPNPRSPYTKFVSDLGGFRTEVQRMMATRKAEAKPKVAAASPTPPPTDSSVPPPANKRVVGKTQWTDPKGVLRVWNGVGWARVKEQLEGK